MSIDLLPFTVFVRGSTDARANEDACTLTLQRVLGPVSSSCHFSENGSIAIVVASDSKIESGWHAEVVPVKGPMLTITL